ncbi:MAG: hypothetical protein OSJ26_00500 [Muribaculaceae bacterium]|nr:hypothetical protein [Muribaculaceae bacterium]
MRLFTIAAIASALSANAQIGYQVSLLDNATGEPRADETVTVEIAITDSNGKTLCSERKSATTNDFGVLSLTVGNSSTFTDADWSALPFFISATVDGTLIGRSQILNVPVAEYAKQTGVLTKEILKSKTWYQNGYKDRYYTFSDDTVTFHEIDDYEHNSWKYKYQIDGNNVFMIKSVSIFELFIYSDNKLFNLYHNYFYN